MEDGTRTHLAASFVSGLVATFCGQPIDMVKTQMQNQSQANRLYTNSFACVYQIAKADGARSLWRGFLPRYVPPRPPCAC